MPVFQGCYANSSCSKKVTGNRRPGCAKIHISTGHTIKASLVKTLNCPGWTSIGLGSLTVRWNCAVPRLTACRVPSSLLMGLWRVAWISAPMHKNPIHSSSVIRLSVSMYFKWHINLPEGIMLTKVTRGWLHFVMSLLCRKLGIVK